MPKQPRKPKPRQSTVDAKKARQFREAADLRKMVERVLRALTRRAGAGEIDALRAVYSLQDSVRTATAEAIAAAQTGGLSFGQIGRELGISKQAAHAAAGHTARLL